MEFAPRKTFKDKKKEYMEAKLRGKEIERKNRGTRVNDKEAHGCDSATEDHVLEALLRHR